MILSNFPKCSYIQHLLTLTDRKNFRVAQCLRDLVSDPDSNSFFLLRNFKNRKIFVDFMRLSCFVHKKYVFGKVLLWFLKIVNKRRVPFVFPDVVWIQGSKKILTQNIDIALKIWKFCFSNFFRTHIRKYDDHWKIFV